MPHTHALRMELARTPPCHSRHGREEHNIRPLLRYKCPRPSWQYPCAVNSLTHRSANVASAANSAANSFSWDCLSVANAHAVWVQSCTLNLLIRLSASPASAVHNFTSTWV
eukprot:gnl/TRDRNA2_/TRDRNA2_176963_c14_seq3.p2 gnl/TRDRNA2_/TRDRNA2_176963_c14~~gnl/TRDRNA2_/TRDRNA2_176963_c14_seq3.p2  ORF type:complete len:111 (-),score=3.57 gnl/TRDRNA2_/TRDRNA2_176963_c14_seq3:225-557(-)